MTGELMACPFLHRDNIEFPKETCLPCEGLFKKLSTHLGIIHPKKHTPIWKLLTHCLETKQSEPT